MCEQCLAIENAIERFHLISQSVNDELTIGKAVEVIAELAAQKALLHRLPPARSNAKRYFFDIRDDDGLLTDDQGLLRDIEAARAEGALLLADMARDIAIGRKPLRPTTVEVRADDGPVFKITLAWRLVDET